MPNLRHLRPPQNPPAPTLIGAVSLPDARDAVLTGDDLMALWSASLDLCGDQSQVPVIGPVAVTNKGAA